MQGVALLDAGAGRRLERFGARVVDRPAATAMGARTQSAPWEAAELRYDRHEGWTGDGDALSAWTVGWHDLTLELRPTDAGQVGLFPEQGPMLEWLTGRIGSPPSAIRRSGQPLRVLNLFGYTGASTLAAALAGATVAHVDASRPAVAWARRNAALSGLSERPIRWLVDDALAFVRREQRRGTRYEGIVLDPPTYGHGGRRAWRLDEQLGELLEACAELSPSSPAFVLLTAHTPGFDADRLRDELVRAFDLPASEVGAGDLELLAASGARLPLGAFARWPH